MYINMDLISFLIEITAFVLRSPEWKVIKIVGNTHSFLQTTIAKRRKGKFKLCPHYIFKYEGH